MSASKLEKNMANLERRMRKEFLLELDVKLEPCLARLAALEQRLQAELMEDSNKVEETITCADVDYRPRPRSGLGAEQSPEKPKGDKADLVEVQVHDPPLEDPMDPVAFLETTWNLVLVAGHAGVGWIDLAIAWLLLFASAGMQITFSVILLTPSFLGDPFDEAQVTVAQEWRNSVAHDAKNMDLARTSLTARVCNNDGGLILSNSQANLVQDIDNFLGLDKDMFQTEGFRPGILLSMLCILLWCLYVGNEFRTIGLSLEAVLQIPRSEKTRYHEGRFETLSYVRFWSYVGLRLLRAGIALALLYAGILWLGGAKAIEDLILNAVALGAILQVDEMVFSALMPKKLQLKIQDLEAIKVHYSRRRSQAESVLILTVMVGLLAWPWFGLLEPLARTMETVKRAYCDGNQDFVVTLNEDIKVTVGFSTVPFQDVRGTTVSQRAVDEFIFKDAERESAKYILMQADLQRFNQYRTMLMTETAGEIASWCLDFDGFFLPGNTPGFAGYYSPHWHSALAGLGLPENTSCEDMAQFCDVDSGSLVRLVCGQTCCSSAIRNAAWFKVTALGCPAGCLQEADKSPTRTCADIHANSTPSWDAFWDAYPSVLENSTGQSLFNNTVGSQVAEMAREMKLQGCSALNNSRWEREVVVGWRWCEGFENLFAPLARLCPESCGCTNLDLADPSEAPAGCPAFCYPRCEDTPFSPIGEVATCADGQALGWCFDAGFQSLCRKTCTGC
eukprot:s4372_g6.t1